MKEIAFFLFSPNHLTKELYSLTHFAVSLTRVRNFVTGESSDKLVADLSWALSVYWITTVSRSVNQCCQALFVLCKGSAFTRLTNLPKGGTNSCRDFSFEISCVTLLLTFSEGSRSLPSELQLFWLLQFSSHTPILAMCH